MTDQPDKWNLADLCGIAVERGASDLHLKAGQPPVLRVEGEVRFTEFATLGTDEILDLALEAMDERTTRQFKETGNIDFSYTISGGDRFRVNVFRQRGAASVAARRVVRRIPTFDELHLPAAVLQRICALQQGLVVVSGVTGCGKSTTIASCLNYVNSHRRCHIVTIEDPIEFLFEDREAFINQREVGTDVTDFEEALRHLPREDPDVVLVGEMRDRHTCESVLRAAETGHLVFTTLHSSSAPGAISRLLDLFPSSEHSVIRQTLTSNLVAVLCQKLVPGSRPDAPLVPAVEIMLSTPGVRQSIRDGDQKRLDELVRAGTDSGMRDFTQDLARLVREEWVEPKVAYEAAPNQQLLKMAIRGIDVKQGTLR